MSDTLEEFVRRAQAAQEAVGELVWELGPTTTYSSSLTVECSACRDKLTTTDVDRAVAFHHEHMDLHA